MKVCLFYSLEELHLSLNNFNRVDLDDDLSDEPSIRHTCLKKLHFTGKLLYSTHFFNNLVTTWFATKMLKTPVIIDHKLTLESHESFVQTISVPNRSQLLYLRGYFYCNSLQGCLAHCGTHGL